MSGVFLLLLVLLFCVCLRQHKRCQSGLRWFCRDITCPFFFGGASGAFIGLGYLRLVWAKRELEAIHSELEIKVEERTLELAQANQHLREEMKGREQAQNEQKKLISELEVALAEVKQLSGFMPICAKCKSIRDDKGYWNRIEKYIENHSDAVFSHGLCPECEEELYSDQRWYRKKEQDES